MRGPMHRRLFVLVDEEGRPVEAAGPAPFDGRTRAEAEREARATIASFEPGWHMEALTPAHERGLRAMALHLRLVDHVLLPGPMRASKSSPGKAKVTLRRTRA